MQRKRSKCQNVVGKVGLCRCIALHDIADKICKYFGAMFFQDTILMVIFGGSGVCNKIYIICTNMIQYINLNYRYVEQYCWNI